MVITRLHGGLPRSGLPRSGLPHSGLSRTSVSLTCIAVVALLITPSRAFGAKRELQPADALATVRVMQNQVISGQAASDLASPDGQRYVIRLAYGDAARNGVWVDLLTGPLSSLDTASHPKRCAHLFTTGLGSTTSALSAEMDPDPTNIIRWLDNTHIALLWSDARSVRQVLSVDLLTCKRQFLTATPGNVFSFVYSSQGKLLYDAQIPTDPSIAARLWETGFTVADSSDGLSILQGHIEDATAVQARFQNSWYLRSVDGKVTPLKVTGQTVDHTHPHFRDLSAAVSGRYAVTWIGVSERPAGWERYTNPYLQRGLTTDKQLPVRYTVIDLESLKPHVLWDAPMSARGHVHWAPADDSLLLAPTYLPLPSNSGGPNPAGPGLTGNAAAVIDARTGAYRSLPLDLTDRTVLTIDWRSATRIDIASTDAGASDHRTDSFTLNDGTWQLTNSAAGADSDDHATSQAPIHLETRQSLDQPPKIFAIDTRTGETRLVLDPNPHLLDTFKLGHIERLNGTLPNGKIWLAQLIYPADYQRDKKYPLVIQSSYGIPFAAEEFTLWGTWGTDGMGLGPTDTPSYVGQLLATRNVAVVDLEVLHFGQGMQEAEDYRLAYEAIAKRLIDSGLADERKIALDGFSQNGYWVEYALAHSTFPFAAAIAVDNYQPSYLQSALRNWSDMDKELNGADAFGPGLQEWIKNAPGFNAEHFHTPLLMLEQSEGIPMIISEWEIYSRLRHLQKPVQMYVMPRADKHPSHLPQNPRQILAIQAMAIDWLEFWLEGREDPSPARSDQYTRWRKIAASSGSANTIATTNP